MKITWDNVCSSLGIAKEDFEKRGLLAPLSAPSLQVSTDSREIKEGQWYLPLKGEHFDGHKFIGSALKSGAHGFFYERKAPIESQWSAKGVEVEDTLKAYQALATLLRSVCRVPTVAITGSNGKTTVKEMAFHVLSKLGPCLKTQANNNNEIGVAKTLLSLTKEHKTALLEFGARHVGDLTELSAIAMPDIRVLLNVGSAHVGEFGSLERLREAKLELLRTGTPSDTLLTCHDDDLLRSAASSLPGKLVTFGYSKEAGVCILGVEQQDGRYEVVLRLPGGEEIRVHLSHFHACYPINMAAAAAIGFVAGVPAVGIKAGLESFEGPKGRFHVVQRGGLTVIDDSYNANPESMAAGLKTLKSHYQNRKMVLVLGDMLELGDAEKEAHQDLGRQAAGLLPSYLVTVGKRSEETHKAAIAAGLEASRAIHCSVVDEAVDKFLLVRDKADLLYVKGSNSIGLSKLVSHSLELE